MAGDQRAQGRDRGEQEPQHLESGQRRPTLPAAAADAQHLGVVEAGQGHPGCAVVACEQREKRVDLARVGRLQFDAQRDPREGFEHLAQGGDLGALAVLSRPAQLGAEAPAFECGEGGVGDPLGDAGGALPVGIVADHEVAVGAALDVELEGAGAVLERPPEGGERVLGEQRARAAVGVETRTATGSGSTSHDL